MKIKGTCSYCDREFLVEQVADSGGRCPWCGRAFASHYAANLVRALREAEVAGDVLEQALEQVADMEPAFELQDDSVLEDVRRSLSALRRRRSRRPAP